VQRLDVSEAGVTSFGLGMVYVDSNRLLIGNENNYMALIQRIDGQWNMVAKVTAVPTMTRTFSMRPTSDETVLKR
jgi:hypothetical protein